MLRGWRPKILKSSTPNSEHTGLRSSFVCFPAGQPFALGGHLRTPVRTNSMQPRKRRKRDHDGNRAPDTGRNLRERHQFHAVRGGENGHIAGATEAAVRRVEDGCLDRIHARPARDDEARGNECEHRRHGRGGLTTRQDNFAHISRRFHASMGVGSSRQRKRNRAILALYYGASWVVRDTV